MLVQLKKKILSELSKAGEEFVSGQLLAEKFNVSRSAVWKAVNVLRHEGCKIESVSNRGYRLILGDTLSEDIIISEMSPKSRRLRLILLDEVDSTNNEAKRIIVNGFNGDALIVANKQTSGRGRLGRSFYSPKNTGAYMSFVFSTDMKHDRAVLITTAAAVAVVRAIERLTDIVPEIKWVNDVYIDGRKICGILTEAVTDFESGRVQSIVIGIGINLTTENFPDEISSRAASINYSGLTRNRIIASVADELVNIFESLDDREYIEDYKAHSLVTGKEIYFIRNNEKLYGKAIDIDDNGGLVVELPNGEQEVLSSGEITVRVLDSM